ncbi:hypothetical protein [Pseudoxanthomonas sp. USHLN014]|uniref:hypothetical protein n=1 Tax=Pseudoxanthomonas sp. USHLN014 TaxID=3081297 RepID=UPI00301B9D0E
MPLQSGSHARKNCQLFSQKQKPCSLLTRARHWGGAPLPSACFLVALVIRAIFERVVVDVEKQKLKLSKLLEVAAKEQAKLLLAEKQQKAREARQVAREKAKERAKLFRSADAHRKIVLGGLTIAAEADGWDPAEIVGGAARDWRADGHAPERAGPAPRKGYSASGGAGGSP